MARGGARAGAGRKVGSATRKTRDVANRAAAEGVTPLEFMLSVMHDEGKPWDARFEAAKSAAPYIHPKLSSVEAKVDVDVATTVERVEFVVVDSPSPGS